MRQRIWRCNSGGAHLVCQSKPFQSKPDCRKAKSRERSGERQKRHEELVTWNQQSKPIRERQIVSDVSDISDLLNALNNNP